MTQETLTTFFGYLAAINIALLMLSAVMLLLMHEVIAKLHARLFKLNEQDLTMAYVRSLLQFKILVFVFSVVPWVALNIMV